MSISWILILTSVLAFYLAWNLGANDVANSMGTSVGSKAISLRQALIIAGILELAGALLFGQAVTATLATKIIDPTLFAAVPNEFVTGMIAVVLASGVWLNIATAFGLPVSSSHAVVGAIAGFSWVAIGIEGIAWNSIGIITLSWLMTPLVSGVVAALFYKLLKWVMLDRPDGLVRLRELIPWLNTAVLSTFGVLVLPTLAAPIQTWLSDRALMLPRHDIALAMGGLTAVGLSLLSWRSLDCSLERQEEVLSSQLSVQENSSENSSRFSVLSSQLEDSNHNTLCKDAAPTELKTQNLELKTLPLIEQQMIRFQLLSAGFVAFAHGANDVGNAIAPLAAIAYVNQTGSVPVTAFEIPLWVMAIGGIGIVVGLATWGKKVIATVGAGIIPLQPSGGFCAQFGAALTVLLASRLGLPVSTSHAIVGGVVGIGLVQGSKSIRFQTLRDILLVWIITIPAATGLSAAIFALLRLLF